MANRLRRRITPQVPNGSQHESHHTTVLVEVKAPYSLTRNHVSSISLSDDSVAAGAVSGGGRDSLDWRCRVFRRAKKRCAQA